MVVQFRVDMPLVSSGSGEAQRLRDVTFALYTGFWGIHMVFVQGSSREPIWVERLGIRTWRKLEWVSGRGFARTCSRLLSLGIGFTGRSGNRFTSDRNPLTQALKNTLENRSKHSLHLSLLGSCPTL